jgi:hypothetical protein
MWAKTLRSSSMALVGGRARLELLSPSFPGKITPITPAIQVIDTFDDAGKWSWEVKADKTGLYEFSLVLNVLNNGNDELC